MAEGEIDIEEHDILENPIIRSIFPDLSFIKKELSQYDEDLPDIKQEPELLDSEFGKPYGYNITSSNNGQDSNTLQQKYLITNNMHNLPCETPNISRISSSKIILGTKPNQADKNKSCNRAAPTSIKIPKVFIEDIGIYLNKNKYYCQNCTRLFPHKTSFASHKRWHDLQVHKSLKSTKNKYKCDICKIYFSSSSNLSRHNSNNHKTNQQPVAINKCSICKNNFSSIYSLARHYSNIHKKKVSFKPKYVNKINNRSRNSLTKSLPISRARKNQISKQINRDTENICFHCKKEFPDKKTLIDHIYTVLVPKQKKNKTVQSKNNDVEHVSKLRQKRGNCATIVNPANTKPILIPGRKSLRKNRKLVTESNKTGNKIKHKSAQKNRNKYDSEYNADSVISAKDKIIFEDNDSDEAENVIDTVRYKSKSLKRKPGASINTSDITKTVAQQKKRNKTQLGVKKIAFTESNNIKNTIRKNTRTSAKMSKICNIKSLVCEESNSPDDDMDKSSQQEISKNPSGIKRNESGESNNTSKLRKNKSFSSNLTDDKVTSKKITVLRNKLQSNVSNEGESNSDHEIYESATTENQSSHEIQFDRLSTNSNEHYNIKARQKNKGLRSALKAKDNRKKPGNIKAEIVHKVQKVNKKKMSLFECAYCSYYLLSESMLYRHLTSKHAVAKEQIVTVNETKFDNQCKFCPSTSCNIEAHNTHIYKYHKDLLQVTAIVIESEDDEEKSRNVSSKSSQHNETAALKSIIYNCNKCDIHFLSPKVARDHINHMEILINWKCSHCRRIFKRHDKHLHMRQHSFLKTLTVYTVNKLELSTVLYHCSKCTIHFSEGCYFKHNTNCDLDTTDSVYCKTCDILIDKFGYEYHEAEHRNGVSDFTIIESDVIPDISINEKVNKKRKRLYEQINSLTFCNACTCYITDTGLSRRAHIEARCSHIPKHVCNICGLVLTNKALDTHRKRHKKDKNLSLQNYNFFDLKGNQINPPLPIYPQCNNCDVFFVSKVAAQRHICSEIESIVCKFCNIKLSESAYKLHMKFHNYSMEYVDKKTHLKSTSPPFLHKNEPKKIKVLPASTQKLCSNNRSGTNMVYTCKSCKVSFTSYDSVIEHCQEHYNPHMIESPTKTCSECVLKFIESEYEIHHQTHARNESFKIHTFDRKYFIAKNATWVDHIFGDTQKDTIEKIISKSIYKNECRIKMEVIQKGSSHVTVYKCHNCSSFIEAECLIAHIRERCDPSKLKRHPCSYCGLPFVSSIACSKHEKIHRKNEDLRIKSYNIVLFNCDSHKLYNTKILCEMTNYILYQCRTCDGIVDSHLCNNHECNVENLQRCNDCQLLIYKENFDGHISQHKTCVRFNCENIKVILFGTKIHKQKTLTSRFIGLVHDYTMYECQHCKVCVNNEDLSLKHSCLSDKYKNKCIRCNLYVSASQFNCHNKMHITDPDFNTENITIIPFNMSESNKNSKIGNSPESRRKENCSNEDMLEKLQGQNIDRLVIIDSNAEIPVTLYKCQCGLHFIDESNINNHIKCCNPKSKVIKQKCTKCSFLFNPKELFSHLLAHHGDKNRTNRYKIIEVSIANDVCASVGCESNDSRNENYNTTCIVSVKDNGDNAEIDVTDNKSYEDIRYVEDSN